MERSTIRRSLVALALLAAWSAAAPAHAQDQRGGYPQAEPASHPLFYNYYAPGPEGVGAQARMYLSPRPTPPLVGHTYITDPRFYPHEYLYRHSRHYYTRYGCSCCDGMTYTKVFWW